MKGDIAWRHTGEPLRGARALARLLDTAFRVPGLGVRFGLDGLLGLIPGAGDAVGLVLSSYILLVGVRLRAPAPVLFRMLLNIGVDALIGTIPLIGDAFDIGWKANARNVALLERWLERPERTHAASRATIAAVLISAAVLLAGVSALLVWAIRLLIRP